MRKAELPQIRDTKTYVTKKEGYYSVQVARIELKKYEMEVKKRA
jgi:hypothetical protein